MAKQKGVCDSFCKGCVFSSYGSSDRVAICTYYLTTDIRRPCPAGTGCTVKQTGKKVSMWEHENDEAWKRRSQNISKEVLHRICACCGTAFDTTDLRRIYCSRKCTQLMAQRAFLKRKRENAAKMKKEVIEQ